MDIVTEREIILIHWLKAIGVSEDNAVNVIISLETVEQQDMLAEFLTANQDATEQDILRETVRILKITQEG